MEVTCFNVKTGKLLLLQTVSKAKPASQISIVIIAITDCGKQPALQLWPQTTTRKPRALLIIPQL